MNNVLFYAIPVIAVFAAAYAAVKAFRKSGSGSKALKVNFIAVALVFSVCVFGAMTAMASGENDIADAPMTTAASSETTGEAAEETTAAAETSGLALGLGGRIVRVDPDDVVVSAVSAAVSPLHRQLPLLSALPVKTPRPSVRHLSSLLWANPSRFTVWLSPS